MYSNKILCLSRAFIWTILTFFALNISATNATASDECTSEFASGLQTSEEVVSFLRNHTVYDCLYDFGWDFSDLLIDFFSEKNVLAVLKEIETIAPQFDGSSTLNIHTLLYYIRLAYYHEFYEEDILGEYSDKVAQANIAAAKVLSANPRLLDETEDAGRVLETWIITIDDPDVAYEFIPIVKTVLSRFTLDLLMIDPQEDAVYNAISLIYRGRNDSLFLEAIEYDYELVEIMANLARRSWLWGTEFDYIARNGVIAMQWLNNQETLIPLILETTQSFTKLFEPFTLIYIRLVSTIEHLDDNNCEEYIDNRGKELCATQIKYELHDMLLPYQYTFFDGEIEVYTALNEGVVRLLYQAMKEIRAQFFRLTQHDTPVEGDTNDVLKIKVFGTRSDYKNFQGFLHNTRTTNGGTYIESPDDFEGNPDYGTFYTFQRTPIESDFTLEELFRHEYVHYLCARFLVEGDFNSAPIDNTDRIAWFGEGIAEYLAWSTSREGVKTQLLNVKDILEDSVRMSVKEIVESQYGTGFDYYSYGALLIEFLSEERPGLFKQIISLIRETKPEEFVKQIDEIGADEQIQIEFDLFLDEKIDKIDNLERPHTERIHPDSLRISNSKIIQFILNIITRWGLSCEQVYSNSVAEVQCQGPMHPGRTNQVLNSGLERLATLLRINNFQDFTCYNIEERSQTYCSGPLRSTSTAYDEDADGYPNSIDEFPSDNRGWQDLNGNGVLDLDEMPDADEDNLPDGYEVAHYMNPMDPLDAQLDVDADLVSTLDEYLHNSDPLDNSSKIVSGDLYFVRIENNSISPQQNSEKSISIQYYFSSAGTNDEPYKNLTLRYKSSRALKLERSSGVTQTSDTEGELVYTDDRRSSRANIIFTPLEAGEYEITFTVSVDEFIDADLSNNQQTLQINVLAE